MARIGKAEHARILHLADVEHRRIADIAAEYGCSVANIYSLLGKLRRATPAPPVQEAVARPAPAPVPEAAAAPEATSVVDLFAVPTRPVVAVQAAARPAPPQPKPVPPPAIPARPAAPAKSGYGLVMRSAEGEDSLAPFRSLEDLLGAVKPILRAAATSPEPVWFCIQPVDLATLEEDA